MSRDHDQILLLFSEVTKLTCKFDIWRSLSSGISKNSGVLFALRKKMKAKMIQKTSNSRRINVQNILALIMAATSELLRNKNNAGIN